MGKTKRSGKEHWVGFDLGGTKMLAIVFDGKFKQVGKARKRSKARDGEAAGLERMAKTIREALDDAGIPASKLAGIGVGCPGPLNLDRGVILELPNLHWKNVKVKETLESAFKCPVVIANDVDAGVYGEYSFGAAQGARCVVGVFPGTGIGGGGIYEGRILRGQTGSCMEIGHMPAVPDGPFCGCGQRGCLEAVAGRLAISAELARAAYRGQAPNLQKIAGTDLAEIRSGVIAASIKAGDAMVERIVRVAARRIGFTMAGVVNLLAPDTVLLGGGMVEEMPDLFSEEIEAGINERVMPSYRNSFDVVVSSLGDDAVVAGVAAWASDVAGS